MTEEEHEELDQLIKEAVWTVDAFDQANTNGTITKLHGRGFILAKQIDDLRRHLVAIGHPPTIAEQQTPNR